MDAKIAEGILEIIHSRSPRAWLVIDRHYTVVYVNDAICKIWHRKREDILGRSILDWYNGQVRDEAGRYQGPVVQTLETGEELREVEVHLRDPKSFRHYWFLANTHVIADSTGETQYVAANYVEIDKFKAIEHRMKDINVSIIRAFAKAIGTRDAYTLLHEEQVAALMVGLAEYMDMTAEDISTAYLAGLVHDVGKLGVPEALINKPNALTAGEYSQIKLHAAMGADILAEVDGFKDIAAIVRFHHERYDGTGYPAGLAEGCIPVFSRMLAVCDAYDAMTSLRCYRKPVSPDEALSEIERCAGSQFDPVISARFCRYIRENIMKQLCC